MPDAAVSAGDCAALLKVASLWWRTGPAGDPLEPSRIGATSPAGRPPQIELKSDGRRAKLLALLGGQINANAFARRHPAISPPCRPGIFACDDMRRGQSWRGRSVRAGTARRR